MSWVGQYSLNVFFSECFLMQIYVHVRTQLTCMCIYRFIYNSRRSEIFFTVPDQNKLWIQVDGAAVLNIFPIQLLSYSSLSGLVTMEIPRNVVMATQILQFILNNLHIHCLYTPCVGVACISLCLSFKTGMEHMLKWIYLCTQEKKPTVLCPCHLFTLYVCPLNENANTKAKFEKQMDKFCLAAIKMSTCCDLPLTPQLI